MWPLPAVSSRMVIAAAILSLVFLAGWHVNGWRLNSAHSKELQKMLQAGLDAVTKREAIIEANNVVIAGLEAEKGKVRIIYRNAVRTDPECKAWSEQPIVCPRSWQP